MSDTLNQFGNQPSDVNIDALAEALPTMSKKDMLESAEELGMVKPKGTAEEVRAAMVEYVAKERGEVSIDITHANNGATIESLSPHNPFNFLSPASAPPLPMVEVDQEGKIMQYHRTYWRNPYTNHTVALGQADTDGRVDIDGYAVYQDPPNPSDAQDYDNGYYDPVYDD